MLKLKSATLKSNSAAIQTDSFFRTRRNVVQNEQILITIASVEAKAGATHLALSLALKASQRGLSTAVILSHESFEALKQYYVLSVREEPSKEQKGEQGREPRQFASFAGLSIMAGVLPGDLEGFQLLIWDCGSLPQGKRCFSSGNLRCIVSGGQAWELAPLNALLMDLDYRELARYAVCIRGASEPDYHHIKQQMLDRLPCINMLHKPDWTDVQLREDLVAILRLVGY